MAYSRLMQAQNDRQARRFGPTRRVRPRSPAGGVGLIGAARSASVCRGVTLQHSHRGAEHRERPVHTGIPHDLADHRASRSDVQLPWPAPVHLSTMIRAPLTAQSQAAGAVRSATMMAWSPLTDASASQNCWAFPDGRSTSVISRGPTVKTSDEFTPGIL